ncbi:helix-turn-helix domain-containing protein [Pricia sp.]|uniref:helix-turn-helix domain-containing protein n=1 Tax=Pricia sp. TaxID=2268138 RepID=UPI0035937966
MSSFNVNADLVPLFHGLVTGLQPFANAQQVTLNFKAEVPHLYAPYNPVDALSKITVLLTNIITFTPQSYSVTVSVGSCSDTIDRCMLSIENTGVDLSRVVEIVSTVSDGLRLEKLDRGTRFIIEIPVTPEAAPVGVSTGNGLLTPKKYPFYFSAVSKKLASHFTNSKNLENTVSQLNATDGVFLKKINAIINANMNDSEFKVDSLASAVALSRSQLFRKLKTLTRMSPQKYLRFIRLERAKKMLQSKSVDANVSEVGYQTGFASKSHFTRAFQREFGFNPSDIK